ncbi:MAG: hypothetical protein ACP5MI_11375 [Candidatus Kryptoniota bacterium]
MTHKKSVGFERHTSPTEKCDAAKRVVPGVEADEPGGVTHVAGPGGKEFHEEQELENSPTDAYYADG